MRSITAERMMRANLLHEHYPLHYNLEHQAIQDKAHIFNLLTYAAAMASLRSFEFLSARSERVLAEESILVRI